MKQRDEIYSGLSFLSLIQIQWTRLLGSNLITHPSTCPAHTPRSTLPLPDALLSCTIDVSRYSSPPAVCASLSVSLPSPSLSFPMWRRTLPPWRAHISISLSHVGVHGGCPRCGGKSSGRGAWLRGSRCAGRRRPTMGLGVRRVAAVASGRGAYGTRAVRGCG
jgi:hypothetical protein